MKKNETLRLKKNIQCQSKVITYLETIQELQSKQSKLTADLEDCTDVDLVISKQELKECNQELEAEVKNVRFESEKQICEDKIISRNQTILVLKSKITKVEGDFQETRAEVKNGVNEMAILKKRNEDLKMRLSESRIT